MYSAVHFWRKALEVGISGLTEALGEQAHQSIERISGGAHGAVDRVASVATSAADRIGEMSEQWMGTK